MIKAKEVSVKNIVVFLVFSFAISAGYFLARPHTAMTKSVPVFMGEEVVISRPLSAAVAEKAATAGSVSKAQTAVKVQTAPAPQPKATPLPIVPPAIILKVLPSYPEAMLGQGLQGTVLLSVYVGLSGKAEKIEVKTSSGFGELDQSAQEALAQWKFSPASQGGVSLASWFEVPVKFVIK